MDKIDLLSINICCELVELIDLRFAHLAGQSSRRTRESHVLIGAKYIGRDYSHVKAARVVLPSIRR